MTSRALIIGGGIAGPVTAIALREVGMDPVVYEAYEHGADTVGAWLTLAANGLDALRALDLHTVVRDNGFDTHAIELSMSSGKVLGRWSMGTLPDGTPTQSISRPAIYEALRDEAVRRGVRIEYGRRLVAAEDTGRGVLARFADGTEASGDLLIGADGLRSTVRQVIDPNAPRARYVPLLNTGGYARRVPVDAAPGTMHMIIGKRCFLGYVRHPDGTVWWFANPPQAKELSRSELAAITPDQWRARLIGLFEGDLELAVRLIESSPEVFSGWNTYDFPTVPNWHNGRMVIIGDAAHAMSPAAGQGAAQAIEDAVTLAKCLRDLPDVTTAFATYESIRRERVERVVRQGKANGDQKALGPVFRLLLPVIFKLKARKGEDDPHWMWQHHIEWAAPVTPAT